MSGDSFVLLLYSRISLFIVVLVVVLDDLRYLFIFYWLQDSRKGLILFKSVSLQFLYRYNVIVLIFLRTFTGVISWHKLWFGLSQFLHRLMTVNLFTSLFQIHYCRSQCIKREYYYSNAINYVDVEK